MAAVLAAGPGAVLSHRSAGALWGIRPSARPRFDVTLPRWVPDRPGIEIHHAVLPADEVTRLDGIPVTTVPRTLLDLATVLDRRQLERAVNEAEVRRLWDELSLAELVERHPGRRGITSVKAILTGRSAGASVTRSELEERFLAFLDAEGFATPETNGSLWLEDRWIEADCVWRAESVVVELDSRGFHDTAAAFENDRARDRTLQAAGWRPIRVTWRQLHQEREALAADLRALLTSLPGK
jgi:hypothetical protein